MVSFAADSVCNTALCAARRRTLCFARSAVDSALVLAVSGSTDTSRISCMFAVSWHVVLRFGALLSTRERAAVILWHNLISVRILALSSSGSIELFVKEVTPLLGRECTWRFTTERSVNQRVHEHLVGASPTHPTILLRQRQALAIR